MAKITLDSIRESVETKFAAFEIDLGKVIVKLVNPLRLEKEKRTALIDLQSQSDLTDESDPDAYIPLLRQIIETVTETPEQAHALLKECDDDLLVLMEIVSAYFEGTQAGEALPSVN